MWRTILGVSVVIIAVFSLSMASLLAGRPLFESARPYASGALVAAGVTAWFVGRIRGKRRKQSEDPEDDASDFSITDLRYWGPMLVILGVITLFVWPLQKPTERTHAAPPAPAKKKPLLAVAPRPAPKPAPIPTNAPPVFPPLKLQGVMIRDGSSFAILNGEAYMEGDRIGAVLVKDIDRDSALIEMNGETKVLKLD